MAHMHILPGSILLLLLCFYIKLIKWALVYPGPPIAIDELVHISLNDKENKYRA